MRANDEIVVRPSRETDRYSILALMRTTLGEGPAGKTSEYWHWKHSRNPFGESPVLVAEAGGALVGLRVFMPWTWRCDEHELPAVRAVDTATHPDWQGRGIFTRLTLAMVEQVKEEGRALIFNTPNAYSWPGYKKMGWENSGRVTIHVRPCRPLRVLRAAWAAKNSGNGTRQEELLGSSGRTVVELLAEPELAALLVANEETDKRIATRVSRKYLAWRYAEIPNLQYGAAWSWNEGIAAIIYRILWRRGLRELRLCELLISSEADSVRAGTGLIRSVIRSTRPDFVSAMAASKTPARRALLKSGFLPAPRTGPLLAVRPLKPDLPVDPLARSSWRLSIGDLELF